MPEALSDTLRQALTEILAESFAAGPPEGTPRRVHGRLALPGKVTAVDGMRRVGKTTFLHQVRRERLAPRVPRTHVPSVQFEDERWPSPTMNGSARPWNF